MTLRTYLGTAPGVGKTYAMLKEGRRRAQKGEQVVVGWLERHGREETRAQLGDLEVVPPAAVEYRGHSFPDLDVAAVLATGAGVVLVDELAHTTADGSRQRWQDVADLLAAGRDVLTTANVANLRSLRDDAAQLTGSGTVESVPDEFVRAGEVVLVDMPAESLRRRIASGKVYTADRIGGALAEYFRVPNLEALSELGHAWMDGNEEEVAAQLLARRGLVEPAKRPLIIAGVSESDWGEPVVRRAVRIAEGCDGDLLVVHVRVADGFARHDRGALERYRDMANAVGGSYLEVESQSPADGLAEVARARGADRVVVARHRSRLGELARGSVAGRLRHLLPDVGVSEVRRREPPAPTGEGGPDRVSTAG
ncbi:MAG TPA: universal stress protein [Acidimicrobiales bacterium]|nr:universal stress protein [Acidimicrobiales bacterium]